MNRREFLALSGTLSTAAALPKTMGGESAISRERPFRAPSFRWEEATIPHLQAAMESGDLTSASLTRAYLKRIEELDRRGPRINSVIELNPDALQIARFLDKERKAKGPRGPLHGIPILLKDNIATADKMMTTAGSLALVGAPTPHEAFLVQRLRDAGAVVLGKTNLSEWANFRSGQSTSGWSGRGGLTRNPYVLDRNTSGSSSGSGAAVAANLCAAAIGTETDGSIVSPSSYCGIVGLKPTVGLISRSGIIPISSSQDTAGPMTRTVRDAAILLNVLSAMDPEDSATNKSERSIHIDYTLSLASGGLKGARIGIARTFFPSQTNPAYPIVASALAALKTAGAELVDPVDLKEIEKLGESEFEVMLYEFKDGLNRYLANLGPDAPVKSLKELIAFNESHREQELPYFGQKTFIQAERKGPLSDKAYINARQNCAKAREIIDSIMDEHRLDAIFAPSGGPAHRTDLVHGDRDTGGSSTPAAIAGYPNITVPAGFSHELPMGISFFGRAYSEATLLKIAFGFEEVQQARKAPRFIRSIEDL
jgi:amidase